MNSLANLNQYYIPNTLDGINTITQEVSSSALLVDGSNKMLADLDMNSHQIKNVANGTNADDAVNKSQLDLKADTTYVDTNFLNKVTTTSQNVASRLTFNNTTSGQAYPIIELQNAITGSNNGMYLRFFKNFNRLPNTEIGSIVFADKAATSPATSRAVQLTASIDSVSNPLLNITFDSGNFNPLTISNTQTILRNNDFYIKNKTTAENLLTYFNSTDKWTMYKPLDCNTIDASGDVLIKNNYHLMIGGNPISTGGMRFIYDASYQANGTAYIDARATSLLFRMNTTTEPLSTRVVISNNQTLINSSFAVNGKTFFNDDVLIQTNKLLAFNSGTLSTTNGMIMNYDGGVGFLDVRGTEFRVRTSSAGVPNTIRFKVNDTNTTVINNFFVDGSTTLGNDVVNDTTTFNSKVNVPSGSQLKFNPGSTLVVQSTAIATFDSGSTAQFNSSANLVFNSNSSTLYNPGAFLEYANVQTFLTGSYINGARLRLINSGNTSFQLSNLNEENGVLCNNTSTINITMPVKQSYWNNRSYYIKTQTADVNLVQSAGTSIDNDTNTIGMSSNYRGYHLYFDSDYVNNGKIWRLTQI